MGKKPGSPLAPSSPALPAEQPELPERCIAHYALPRQPSYHTHMGWPDAYPSRGR